MKRTRRVSIEIECHEISIFLTVSKSQADVQTPLSPDPAPIPPACPVCGAPWVFVSPKDGGSQGSHVEQVASAFQQSGLHPPLFAGGMFLICRQSFDQLREQL